MGISERDIEHIFERLRCGVVPERGLDAFAVGIEKERAEIHRQLKLIEEGEGAFKFLRGGYGCGKTFMSRLALLDAQSRGFATSFVVVSDNDLHFHKFDDVYRKVVQELGTAACPRSALGDILDRWIARVEDELISAGAVEEAPDFDEKVQNRMEENLASFTRGSAPEDMGRVLRTIFALKQEGNLSDAASLISWLSASENVASGAKKTAGIKGDISSRDAMDYLRGILEIVKAAGYRGLAILIDETETILRMRRDVRGRSLNGIRQICDAANSYPGLLWIFTGTPEFFDAKRGVAGLAPLHDRIRFMSHGDYVSLRQPQLALNPFRRERLKEVALKLRELYPAGDRALFNKKIALTYIDQLIDKVTQGFAGDVGVIPRQFLRHLVNIMDLAAEHADFDPITVEGFEPREPSDAENRVMAGQNAYDEEPEDEQGYEPVEF